MKFLNSKLAIMPIIALSVYVGSMSYLVGDMPDNIERPYWTKLLIMTFTSTGFLSKVGELLRIGSQAVNFRNIMELYSGASNYFNNFNTEFVEMNNVSVKIYYPDGVRESEETTSAMIYIHGGGYFLRSLEAYDHYLNYIASNMNMKVISIDYRLVPEHPFPAQFEDCYKVVKYVLDNWRKLNIDLDRLVMAGDSAGGSLVASINQQLVVDNLRLPKIQILTYPNVQLATILLPSHKSNLKTGLLGNMLIDPGIYLSWIVGAQNSTNEIIDALHRNELLALIDDPQQQQYIISLLDVDKIPDVYKINRSDYETHEKIKYPVELAESSIFKRDDRLRELFKNLFQAHISPLFADESILRKLPKAYVTVLEWDILKDESLLYAERLRKAGVEVHVSFYENVFHGLANFVQPYFGFQASIDMADDLISYLKKNL